MMRGVIWVVCLWVAVFSEGDIADLLKEKKKIIDQGLQMIQKMNSSYYDIEPPHPSYMKINNNILDLYAGQKYLNVKDMQFKIPNMNKQFNDFRFKSTADKKLNKQVYETNIQSLLSDIQTSDIEDTLVTQVSNTTDLDVKISPELEHKLSKKQEIPQDEEKNEINETVQEPLEEDNYNLLDINEIKKIYEMPEQKKNVTLEIQEPNKNVTQEFKEPKKNVTLEIQQPKKNVTLEIQQPKNSVSLEVKVTKKEEKIETKQSKKVKKSNNKKKEKTKSKSKEVSKLQNISNITSKPPSENKKEKYDISINSTDINMPIKNQQNVTEFVKNETKTLIDDTQSIKNVTQKQETNNILKTNKRIKIFQNEKDKLKQIFLDQTAQKQMDDSIKNQPIIGKIEKLKDQITKKTPFLQKKLPFENQFKLNSKDIIDIQNQIQDIKTLDTYVDNLENYQEPFDITQLDLVLKNTREQSEKFRVHFQEQISLVQNLVWQLRNIKQDNQNIQEDQPTVGELTRRIEDIFAKINKTQNLAQEKENKVNETIMINEKKQSPILKKISFFETKEKDTTQNMPIIQNFPEKNLNEKPQYSNRFLQISQKLDVLEENLEKSADEEKKPDFSELKSHFQNEKEQNFQKEIQAESFLEKSQKVETKSPRLELLNCDDNEEMFSQRLYLCSKQCFDKKICKNMNYNSLFQLNIKQQYKMDYCDAFTIPDNELFENLFQCLDCSQQAFWNCECTSSIKYTNFQENQKDLIIKKGDINCNNGNATFAIKFNKYFLDSCIALIFRYIDQDNYNELAMCYNNTIQFNNYNFGKKTNLKSVKFDLQIEKKNHIGVIFYSQQMMVFHNSELVMMHNSVQFNEGSYGFKAIRMRDFEISNLQFGPVQVYPNQIVSKKSCEKESPPDKYKIDFKVENDPNALRDEKTRIEKEKIYRFQSQKCVIYAHSDNQICINQSCQLQSCTKCCLGKEWEEPCTKQCKANFN